MNSLVVDVQMRGTGEIHSPVFDFPAIRARADALPQCPEKDDMFRCFQEIERLNLLLATRDE